jgi:hypothetical protein
MTHHLPRLSSINIAIDKWSNISAFIVREQLEDNFVHEPRGFMAVCGAPSKIEFVSVKDIEIFRDSWKYVISDFVLDSAVPLV